MDDLGVVERYIECIKIGIDVVNTGAYGDKYAGKTPGFVRFGLEAAGIALFMGRLAHPEKSEILESSAERAWGGTIHTLDLCKTTVKSVRQLANELEPLLAQLIKGDGYESLQGLHSATKAFNDAGDRAEKWINDHPEFRAVLEASMVAIPILAKSAKIYKHRGHYSYEVLAIDAGLMVIRGVTDALKWRTDCKGRKLAESASLPTKGEAALEEIFDDVGQPVNHTNPLRLIVTAKSKDNGGSHTYQLTVRDGVSVCSSVYTREKLEKVLNRAGETFAIRVTDCELKQANDGNRLWINDLYVSTVCEKQIAAALLSFGKPKSLDPSGSPPTKNESAAAPTWPANDPKRTFVAHLKPDVRNYFLEVTVQNRTVNVNMSGTMVNFAFDVTDSSYGYVRVTALGEKATELRLILGSTGDWGLKVTDFLAMIAVTV